MRDFHPSRYVGTRVTSRLHYLLSHTKAGKKYVFEYFAFRKTSIM
jgi:hypothetical protein